MWFSALLLSIMIFSCIGRHAHQNSAEDVALAGELVGKLKNDANLDLPVDEEYEDLRAELLAYHTALASLAAPDTRRGMRHTPCWKMGGICVNYKLCSGFRYLTEVNGCKDQNNVCCFTWNRHRVRDFREHGFHPAVMPWSHQIKYGGEGIKLQGESDVETTKKRKLKNVENSTDSIPFLIEEVK